MHIIFAVTIAFIVPKPVLPPSMPLPMDCQKKPEKCRANI